MSPAELAQTIVGKLIAEGVLHEPRGRGAKRAEAALSKATEVITAEVEKHANLGGDSKPWGWTQ